jgi:hypothetical protein
MSVKILNYTNCVCCKEEFSKENVFTKEGAAETQISGMCEKCFDAIFEEEEEDDEQQ